MTKLMAIRHADASDEIISNVIATKSQAWSYPYESQQVWIANNLSDNDLHVFLYEDEKIEAYLNLIDITPVVNGIPIKAYGIGNVCSCTKRMGYGNKLMKLTNDYLKMVQRAGLLFCHEHVEPFYAKCGWTKIGNHLCRISGLTPEIKVYAYLLPHSIESLLYDGKLF